MEACGAGGGRSIKIEALPPLLQIDPFVLNSIGWSELMCL